MCRASDEVRGAAREALTEIECYLTSPKFSGPDADYVHVRTDILPKIAAVRFLTIAGRENHRVASGFERIGAYHIHPLFDHKILDKSPSPRPNSAVARRFS
jgi:hypothetical protein